MTLRDGRNVTLREIRPDDADAMRAAFERLSTEARYTRFMSVVKLTPAMVERAVRPLADRERVLVGRYVGRESARSVLAFGMKQSSCYHAPMPQNC